MKKNNLKKKNWEIEQTSEKCSLIQKNTTNTGVSSSNKFSLKISRHKFQPCVLPTLYVDWHQNLYTSLAQSQYQTPLQPSPDAATPQRSNAMESTLYTSKNPSFYPCKNDGENAEDIRSAFKPIKRKLPRLPLNAAQSLYHSETSYYNNPNATAGLPSNSFYQYPQAPVHPPNGESYNLSHAMASNNNLRSGPKPAIWSPAANIESSSKPVDVFDPRNAVDAIPNNPTMISETDFYKSMPSAITRCRPISHSKSSGNLFLKLEKKLCKHKSLFNYMYS